MLVTRPEPGATETASRLSGMGFSPVVAPCLVIQPRPASLPSADRVQAVLAASRNAVAGLPPAFCATMLLAVGDATASAARHAGFTCIESAAGDAAALAALAARCCNPGGLPLLLAAGAGQGGTLAADLRARGFRVLRRAVYEAAPATELPSPALDALAGGAICAALFLSGDTARAFAHVLPPGLRPALAGMEALAISPRAAAPLRALPWRHVRVALRPTQEEVLALLR